jgi:membrane fusion protein, multidrug efflux system
VKSARASVVAAEAAVATAKLNLGFTQVRSLITGVAGLATTQVGSLVSTQTALTSVSQLNPIKAYFSISDAEYLSLSQRAHQGKGDDFLQSAAAVPLTLSLSNGQEYPLKGHIVFVDRQINAQTGAIRIAAAFPNPNNLLRPGQFGRVKAATETRHGALLVPQVAIQDLQGLHQVYVATNGKAHLATVELGQQIGTNWLVESGIEPGALVITDNLQKLGEGAPVSPHRGPAIAPTDAGNNSAGR